MIAIKVPPLGESIVEATVSRWAKQPGEPVAAGETLVELETDKVTVEVPALKAGVLASIAKHPGDIVTVDELLGEVDDTAAVPATTRATPPTTVGASSAPASAPTVGATPAGDGGVRASPAAQRLAAREGVDLARVAGTGRGGVVSKPDVMEHLARAATPPRPTPTVPSPLRGDGGSRPPAARPPALLVPLAAATIGTGSGARESREKMTTRRKRIADNLVQAQQATAHLTTFNEIDMSAVVALRDRWRARVEKEQGLKLTFMPFFVKAASLALHQYPVVNAQIEGDVIVY
jgi:2-oxoglutarate dehydrogenase E2 component (dihydrolipoamide succinyltransferase)